MKKVQLVVRNGRTVVSVLLSSSVLSGVLLSPRAVWSQVGAEPSDDAALGEEAGAFEQAALVDDSSRQRTPILRPDAGSDLRSLVGQAGGLTSDQAARQAAAYSQEAKVAEADHQSARAQQSRTIFNYAPRLTLTASYTRQSIPEQTNIFGGTSLVGTTATGSPLADDELFAIDGASFNFNPIENQYYLNAGLVVPISDYLLNMTQSLEGVRAAKKTAKLNEKAARVSAAANARLAYYDWVRAKLAQGEADKSLHRAREQHKLLQDLHSAGRVARADVLRQDAFVANSELNVRRAATQETVARQNLHMMMNGGKGNAPSWRIGEDILREQLGDAVKAEDLERYHREALQNRLEIQALDTTVYALGKQKSVEKTRAFPRVEGFGNVTYANPNPRFFPQEDEWNTSWDVGIRAVWTVNDIGSASADANVTNAEVARVKAQRQQVQDALRTEVLSAHQGMQEAGLARESAERGVAAAEAAHDDRKMLFEGGRATAFDVLDAETTLVTARLNLVQAYVALRMARVRFDHALGRDVSDVVKAPPSDH